MSTYNGTKVNQLIRQNSLNEQLAPYLPFLTSKQRKSLQDIAWADEYPETKQAWAELLNISRFAFYKWLTNYNFIKALQIVAEMSNAIHIPTIIANLHNRAKDNKDDCKIVLEYQHLIQPEKLPIITNTTNIAFIMTNKDKIKQIADQLAFDSLVDPKLSGEVIEGQIEVGE